MAATIGDNVRNYRRRAGMNQPQLAEAAGLSPSTVAKVEQGGTIRIETLHMLARALGVSTSALMSSGPIEPVNDNDSLSLQLMPLRKLLMPPVGFPSQTSPSEDVPDLGALQRIPLSIERAYEEDDYQEISAQLPMLIRDVNAAVDYFDAGAERTSVLTMRIRLLRIVGKYLTQLRQYDLAYQAWATAIRDARELHSDLDVAASVSGLCWLFLRQGRLEECANLAVETADRIEPSRISKAAPEHLAVWGYLHLRVAAGAVRNNEYAVADQSNRLAASAASAIETERVREKLYGNSFGPVIVATHEIEDSMIKGDARTALELADRAEISPSARRRTGNPDGPSWNRHRLDVAKAHVRLRHYDDGMREMVRLRHHAPEWLVHQRMARETMEDVLHTRKRTLTKEMRDMASFLGVVG